MLLTARYLAEHGVVPVEQWHPKMGCVIGPPLNREIPYAEYIDREEFHRYYGQAVRKLNPENLIIQWSPISDFTFTQISDLSPLTGSNLKTLDLASCKGMKSIEPINECPLKHLSINGTNVTDLRPVEHMDLDYLYVTERNIEYGMDFVKRVTLKMKKAPKFE